MGSGTNTSNYYYNQLGRRQQEAYHDIYEGLMSLSASFQVPALSARELTDIYFLIRLDHPEIFYTVRFKYRSRQGADHVELIPEYIFPKQKIIDHRNALEARIKKLCRPAEGLSEKDKELYIHDFICKNIRYDKLKKPYSHEIIGSLGQGVAVCEGIAKAVRILCDRLGIWCIIALSDSNPEKNIKYRHAWNIVNIGGQYYHLDATFDNSLGRSAAENCGTDPGPTDKADKADKAAQGQGNGTEDARAAQIKSGKNQQRSSAAASQGDIRYDYFNISDKQIFRDHEPVIWKVPECADGQHFYYLEKKLSFTKKEELEKRMKQAAKKAKPFLFHWRGGYMTREIVKDIFDMIEACAVEKGLHAAVSLNWPQAVMLVNFRKEVEAEPVRLEEANEGELYDAEE